MQAHARGRDALGAHGRRGARRAPAARRSSLAAENAPERLRRRRPDRGRSKPSRNALEAEGVACRLLQTSHAFHSPMMDAVRRAASRRWSRASRSRAPTMPIVLDADRRAGSRDDEATRSALLGARTCAIPVRFSPRAATLLETPEPRAPRSGAAHDAGDAGAPARDSARPAPIVCLRWRTRPRARRDALARWPPASSGALGARLDARRLDAARAPPPRAAADLSVRAQALLGRAARRAQRPPCRRRDAPAARSPLPVAAVPPCNARADRPFNRTRNRRDSNGRNESAARERRRYLRLIAQLTRSSRTSRASNSADADPAAHFVELGLDSLSLTQVALQLSEELRRQDHVPSADGRPVRSLDAAGHAPRSRRFRRTAAPAPQRAAPPRQRRTRAAARMRASGCRIALPGRRPAAPLVQQVIQQQMLLMAAAARVARAAPERRVVAQPAAPARAAPAAPAAPPPQSASPLPRVRSPASQPARSTRRPTKKPRSRTRPTTSRRRSARSRASTRPSNELTERQQRAPRRVHAPLHRAHAEVEGLHDEHRPHLADPRVVNGFRPRSRRSSTRSWSSARRARALWDIDGNEYVDALNGFGMNLFGWQPDFVIDAVQARSSISATRSARSIRSPARSPSSSASVTGFDRAGLLQHRLRGGDGRDAHRAHRHRPQHARDLHRRVPRHLRRGDRARHEEAQVHPGRAGHPAATPSENVLVLDYGTPESLEIIEEHARRARRACWSSRCRAAAPTSSRASSCSELRELTEESGALLIFDEVVTGFRAHPRRRAGTASASTPTSLRTARSSAAASRSA